MNFVVLVDHLIVSGSRFLISILIARSLGLEEFGIYALLWTIVTLVSAIQIPVAITPMMQLGPRVGPNRSRSLFTVGFKVQLGYSLLAAPFVSMASLVLTWDRPEVWMIVLAVNAYIFSYITYEFFRRFFFTKGKSVTILIMDTLLYASMIGLLIGAGKYANLGIAGYLLLMAAPMVSFCLISMHNYPVDWFSRKDHFPLIRRIRRIAAPLIISTLAGFISGHVFVYATAVFLGPEDVAGIAAARNILGPLMIFLMALENSMTRQAVILYKRSPEELRSYARSVTRKWLVVFALVVVGASVFAEPLLTLTYGKEYVKYDDLIYWLGVASLMQIVTRVQTIRLRTEGEYLTIKAANIAAMWVSLIVSVPLVYWLGLRGAMLAVIFQQTAILSFLFVPLRLDPIISIIPWGFRRAEAL